MIGSEPAFEKPPHKAQNTKYFDVKWNTLHSSHQILARFVHLPIVRPNNKKLRFCLNLPISRPTESFHGKKLSSTVVGRSTEKFERLEPKNAALPILIASLLAPGEHRFTNLPLLVDVSSTLSLLGRIGCPSLVGNATRVDTSRIAFCEAPYDVVRKMRASVLVLGPLLARHGEALVSMPGGCAIGVRPIDQHLKGLEALGATFTLQDGYIHGRADGLVGADIHLDMPTVTGTENILMAATLAQGETNIFNAAKEPEIVDLANYLRSLGAKITGDGTPVITVTGVSRLTPASRPYRIMPDRIETVPIWLPLPPLAEILQS